MVNDIFSFGKWFFQWLVSLISNIFNRLLFPFLQKLAKIFISLCSEFIKKDFNKDETREFCVSPERA